MFTFQMIYDTYWESAPIPSLFVPYGDASDFYYSGHTGLMFILTMEFWHRKSYFLSACSAIVTILMMQILMIYRIHYSIGKTLV